MYFSHGRSLKLLTLTTLCATMVFSCNQNILPHDKTNAENIVEATATKKVVSSSKVVDFKMSLSLPDVVKKHPELSERTQLLASIDQILETSTGHWEFYSNFKLLFTLVSPDRQNMQAINGQELLFNTITLHTNVQTKLTDAISFNISDCQFQSIAMCDAIEATIFVNTVNGTPRLDQDQDQNKDQSQDQDKDQDQSQDKDYEAPVTSGTVRAQL